MAELTNLETKLDEATGLGMGASVDLASGEDPDEKGVMVGSPRNEKQSERHRPESDGPDEPHPPALPSTEPDQPESPEKSDDVHGHRRPRSD
jgi:hypothetical protein